MKTETQKFGYKFTEIGKIPEEWEVARLEDVTLKIDAGQTAPQGKEYFENGKFPFIRVKHLNELYQGKYAIDFDLINEKAISEYKLKLYPKGSIIFPKSGESIRLERRAILKRNSYVVNHLCIIIPDKKKIDDEFLFYHLTHIKISELLTQTTTPSINLSQIKEIKVSRPPGSEQRKIASIFSTVDEAIQKTDEIIQKTQELKRGLMQELLTRGIGHTKFKRTEIGDIPEEWEFVKLEDVLSQPPQYGLSVKLFSKGNYPILKMDNLEDGRTVTHDLKYANIDKDTFDQFKLEKGDILFNRTNAFDLVGRVGIFLIDGNFTFASYLIRLKISREIADPFFINYYLNADFTQHRLKTIATRGVSQANINAKNLKSFFLPCPPIKEQQKIALILSAIDEKIEKERRRKEQLEKLKKGLMQDLLTGMVRVRVN